MHEFKELPIAHIVESRTNPRKHFDEAGMADLVASILTKGIITPLLVRQTDDGNYELVAGHRRYRAAKKAKLETVPVIIRDLSDEDALEIQVIENLQRADVHPLDEAEGYAALIKATKVDVPALAAKLGKSPTYVYQRMKLNALIPHFKKLMWAGELPLASAMQLARLGEAQQKEMSGYHRDHWMDATELRETIQRNFMLDLGKARFDKKDETLVPAAGSCVACPKHTGHSPELFADIGKGDMCLDGKCFMAKQTKHNAREKAKVEGMGKKIVPISENNWSSTRGVLTHGEYKKVSAKQADMYGEIVDREDNGALVPIKIVDKATTRTDGGSSNDWRAKERAAAKKRDLEQKIRGKIFLAVLEHVAMNYSESTKEQEIDITDALPLGYVDELITFIVSHYSSDQQRSLIAALGLEGEKKGDKWRSVQNRPGPAVVFITQAIARRTAFLQLASHVHELQLYTHSPITAFTVEKEYSDVKEIKNIRRDMTAAAKEKSKKKPAKKGGKK